MKKLLIIVIAILLAGGVGYRWYGAAADRPQFRTLPVTRGDLMIGVTATGQVQPIQIFEVGAQIAGVVKSFGPDAGHAGKTIGHNCQVKEGDVLAQLDDRPHRVELEKAVAGLQMAEAELKEGVARRDQAKRGRDRAERLKGTNSVAEYEAAQSQYEIALAELAVSQAKVEQAKSVKKQAEINLDSTTIRAPADSTVIKLYVDIGQTVLAGQNAFLLAQDLKRMRVLAAVNEADISDVHEGQKVTFKVDEYRDETFTGTVSQIRLDASEVASVINYGVVIDADNPTDKEHPNGRLMPYSTAKVQFEVAHRSNVLLVPDQALRWRPAWDQVTPSARGGLAHPAPRKSRPGDEDGADSEADEPAVEVAAPTVWVRADDGLVRGVPVKLGISDGINTELTGGELHAKDEVVINAVRVTKPDFVSSFVNKVIKK